MNADLKKIVSGAGVALLLRIAGAGGQFVFSVLIARLYGAEGLGFFTLALSLIVISSVLGRWGMDQAALKYIAIYVDQRDWSKVKTIYQQAFKITMTLSAIITLVLLLLSEWIAVHIFNQPELGELLIVLALAVLPFSGLNLLAECFRALKSINAYTVIQSVLVSFFAVAGVLLINSYGFGISSAAYAYVLACYATFSVAFALWRSTLRKNEILEQTDFNLELLKTASPMAWVSIVAIVISFSETILLGIFWLSDEVGIYSAALRVALLTSFIVVAFNSVLAPRFASLIHENKMYEVQKMAKAATVMMIFAALPMVLVFIFFPAYVLQMFGSEFNRGENVLIILAMAQMVNVGMGPAGLLLMMGGYEKVMKKLSIYSWLMSVALALLMIPPYGAVGAACSAFVGIAALNVFAVIAVRKFMGISYGV